MLHMCICNYQEITDSKAKEVHEEKLSIKTSDGVCPAFYFAPTANHQGPCVVFYMDAGGIRPATTDMAKRLSRNGYGVLLPDLYYRYGDYGPFVPEELFAGDLMATLGPLMSTTGNAKSAEDTAHFLSALDARTGSPLKKVGAVGFCMGGGMAIAAAGTCPDRFAAVASFHGGNLATDAPDSPHYYAPKLRAKLYIAAASNDDSYPADMAARFENALEGEGVSFSTQTYPAAHGWMKPDFPIYDREAAEQGWQTLLDFFGKSLD